ncbi:hypothetical protein [Guptibacillus algicola]|uniref:hypothetical protein n=1 Tax=Guptibacillus algicola TaxID=225844 RepID=UPI001CD537DD|nr:hypothetical protein [Alkalihalobacillus algicola]MCA0987464.1 hypothetical protein [Alkalihalobacillus algicola]
MSTSVVVTLVQSSNIGRNVRRMMSEEMLTKIRRVLLYIAFLIIATSIAYVIAYPLGYSPLGYDVIDTNGDTVVLQSFNILGVEDEKVTYQPEEDEEWRAGLLTDLVGYLQQEYFFFFTTLLVGMFWGVLDFIRKKSWVRVVLQFGLLFIVPAVSLNKHLNDIKEILQNYSI